MPTGILKVCLSLVVFLLKFTFFVSYIENLSFGHSVAFFSLCDAVACSLKSNLRPSLKISPPDIFFASGSFLLVQIPTPNPNKKTTSNGVFFCLVGVTGLLRSLRSSALPTGILKVCLSLVVFLLKFTFFVSYIENLSFGHSVAFFSLCDAVACSLKSNLRPSLKISPPDIFFASGSFSLVQIPTPIPNKKTTSNGGFFCLVGVTGFEPATSTSRT